MTTNDEWLEEARKRADSKHGAKQLRFLAAGDTEPKDDDIICVEVGARVEGQVLDLTEVVTQFGPTISATVDDAKYGTVKILAGPKLLADLFEQANVGDFVSMEWLGKKATKAGDGEYRNWSVAHVAAPGSEPKVISAPTNWQGQTTNTNPSATAPAMGADDDLDDL